MVTIKNLFSSLNVIEKNLYRENTQYWNNMKWVKDVYIVIDIYMLEINECDERKIMLIFIIYT